jgi:hypothetical protein
MQKRVHAIVQRVRQRGGITRFGTIGPGEAGFVKLPVLLRQQIEQAKVVLLVLWVDAISCWPQLREALMRQDQHRLDIAQRTSAVQALVSIKNQDRSQIRLHWHERHIFPDVRVVETLADLLRCSGFFMHVCQRHADRLTNIRQHFTGFIHDGEVFSGNAGVTPVVHFGYIAVANARQRVQ